MTTHEQRGSASDDQDALPTTAWRELTDGLVVLWRAYDDARDAGLDRWEFAVEVQQF